MATWLDGCTRQTWGTDGGSWTRQPAMVCIHSTETGSFPGYDNGQTCPHFTIQPTTGERRQHVPMDRAARALAHPAGTPETNRAGVIQIEVIGTCDRGTANKHGYLYLPDAAPEYLDRIGALVGDVGTACGIDLDCTVDFEPYPDPGYGSGPPRISWDAWATYRGVLGHQHVPGNDHGDPGDIDVATILDAATGGFLMGLTQAQQNDLKSDTDWTAKRVAGMLPQRWYTVDADGVAHNVPEGTAGAKAGHALDTLDGNSLQRAIADVGDRVDALADELATLLDAFDAAMRTLSTRRRG